MDYKNKLEKAKTFSEIFDIVQHIVKKSTGLDQAGVMLGVTDMGEYPNGFLGAFYSLDSNMIIINEKPIARLLTTNPKIYNYYLFHVILHEYLHSVGFTDESETRQMVYEISRGYFGDNHIVTQLAFDIQKFIPILSHPQNKLIEPKDTNIEFVKGIDRKNINYIN